MSFRKGNKIITEGLVLALDAANTKSYPGTGTTWKDLTRGNDGTLTNQISSPSIFPTFDSANHGSLDFSGATPDRPNVSIANHSDFDFSLEQTIFMVLKPEESDGNRRNPYNQAYGGFGTITHEIAGGFNYYHGTNGGNAQPYQGTGTSFTLAENEIASITVTRNENHVKWYKNGIFSNQANNNHHPAGSDNPSTAINRPISIGNGYTNPWLGKIYLVYLYNRALTADEVLQNHKATNHRYGI